MAEGESGLPPDLAEIGNQFHPTATVIPVWDWYRANEAAAQETKLKGRRVTASQVVRDAVRAYLDDHPQAAAIKELAIQRLRDEQALQARRDEMGV